MRKILTIYAVAAGLLAGARAPAVDRYVATNGAHSAPYTNWATAATNIQTALNAATNAGDIVWVSNGTYNITAALAMTRAATLRSLNGPAGTIIAANYPVTAIGCFSMTHSNAVLEGFTITRGGGAGVYGAGVSLNSGGIVQNCTIISNTTTVSGGGVCIGTGGGTVSNCVISDNRAANGGGVFMTSTGYVYNCTIARNVITNTSGYGGGIFFNSNGVAVDCVINGNSAARGGGIWSGCPGNLARNCLIINNTALLSDRGGGGVDLYDVATLQNCTICSNRGVHGGGIYVFQHASTALNTIIYNNTVSAGTGSNWYLVAGATCVVLNSCTAPTNGAGFTGSGNINQYPRFLDWPAGNYRLPQDSPCVDSGANAAWMAGALDLAGHRRIWNEIVDMGCYEYIGPGMFFSVY